MSCLVLAGSVRRPYSDRQDSRRRHQGTDTEGGAARTPRPRRNRAGTPSRGVTKDHAKEGLTLTPEQLEKLGVTTQPAQAIEYREESIGYGVVLDHQAIAQAVADLQTAQATAQFSKASLERARQLHGTQGAISADLEQTAEQKAAVDSAALTLATEKLSTTWGMKPPWKDIHDSRVQSLAHGDTQLVRVTFPLGPCRELRLSFTALASVAAARGHSDMRSRVDRSRRCQHPRPQLFHAVTCRHVRPKANGCRFGPRQDSRPPGP